MFLTRLCCFYWQILSFVVSSIDLSLRMILFEYFWYLVNDWQLNILSRHYAPNFIWGFLYSTYIIFIPSNVNHSRKEMENSCGKVFSRWRNNHQARSDLSNLQHHKLGDSSWQPPGPINSSVCILSLPCFLSTILPLHKLEASASSF
jgi:hypothetical protein